MNGKGAGRLARLSAIITILPASMAAGWIAGYFLVDRYLESFPWGTIAGTLAGAAAGFYEIVRILIPAAPRKGLPPDEKS
jgi:F0F1-type ATP synthase assembly protein I